MEQEKEYYAFISYKREDEKWAKWLQNQLEHYRFSTNINGVTDIPKNIRPIFRDVTDLASGLLTEEINKALRNSKWLIIICSPRSAKSIWVCKEVQTFIDLGQTKYIIPFIIEGTPFSRKRETECYPEALLNLTQHQELLAININEMGGREAAAIKVIARMFNLRFDNLWQRYEREQRTHRRLITGILLLGLVIALTITGIMFYQYRKIQINRIRAVTYRAIQLTEQGKATLAKKILLEVLPNKKSSILHPHVEEAEVAFRKAYNSSSYIIDNNDEILSVNFNNDGKYLVSTSSNNIKIWDTENGECIRTLDKVKNNFQSSIFGNNSKYILTLLERNLLRENETDSIKLLNLETGSCISHAFNLPFQGFDIAYCDTMLIFLKRPNKNEIFTAETQAIKQKKKFNASVFKQPIIYFLDIATGNEIKTIKLPSEEWDILKLSNNGSHCITVSNLNKNIKIYETGTGELIKTLNLSNNIFFNIDKIENIELSNDIRFAAIIADQHLFFLVDTETKQIVEKFKFSAFINNSSMIFSNDLSYIASIKNNKIQVQRIGSKNIRRFENGFNINGKYIATLSNEGYVLLWDIEKESYIESKNRNKFEVYSPDKRFHIINSNDTIKVRDLSTKKFLNKSFFYNNDQYNRDLIVSKDYSPFEIIDSTSNKSIIKIIENQVEYVVISPDGKHIISSKIPKEPIDHKISFYEFVKRNEQENLVQLWNIKTGECIETFNKNHYKLNIDFSSNGKFIIFDSGRSIEIYKFCTLETMINDTEKLCKNYPLTDQERKEYFLE